MSSRSLLMVLLILLCLQVFTTAQNKIQNHACCFSFLRRPIPVKDIKGFELTDNHCTKPGVIFSLKTHEHVCADPRDEWVQERIRILTNQRVCPILIQTPPTSPYRMVCSHPSAKWVKERIEIIDQRLCPILIQ